MVVTGGPKSLKNLKMNNVVDIIRDTHLAPIIVYVILRVGGVVGKLLLCKMTYILSLLPSLRVYEAVCVYVCVCACGKKEREEKEEKREGVIRAYDVWRERKRERE